MELISTTIEKIGDYLPCKLHERKGGQNKLREYVHMLRLAIDLPQVELGRVADALLNLYAQMDQTSAGEEDVLQSKAIIIELILDAISTSVPDYEKMQYRLTNFQYKLIYYEIEDDDLLISFNHEDADDLTVYKKKFTNVSTLSQRRSPRISAYGVSSRNVSPMFNEEHSFQTRSKRLDGMITRKTIDAMINLLYVQPQGFVVPPKFTGSMEGLIESHIISQSSIQQYIVGQHLVQHLRAIAKEIIFKVCLADFNVVSQLVENSLGDVNMFNNIRAFEFMPFSLGMILNLIKILIQNWKQISKHHMLNELPHILRIVVMNWVENHPEEVQILYKKEKDIPQVLSLFELFFNVKNLNEQTHVWPLLTVLLCLSPEKTVKITNVNLKTNDPCLLFFTTYLMASVSSKKESFVAYKCFSDISRFARVLTGIGKETGPKSFIMFLDVKLNEYILSTANEGYDIPTAVLLLRHASIRNESKVLAKHFPTLIESSFLDNKIAAVHSILEIIACPLNTRLLLYIFDTYIPKCRKLLLDVTTSLSEPEDMKSNRLSGVRPISQSSEANIQLLTVLLHVFAFNPNTLFHESQIVKDEKGPISALTSQCVLTIVDMFLDDKMKPVVRFQCYRIIRKLFFEKYLDCWKGVPSKDVALHFADLSAAIIDKLARALLRIDGTNVKLILVLLSNITQRSNKLYNALKNAQVLFLDTLSSHKARLESLETLSSDLLVCLCSSEREVWAETTKCLTNVCEQIQILDNQALKRLNFKFYQNLTNVNINGDMDVERKKQIHLFSTAEVFAKSYLDAFNEIFRRWITQLQLMESKNNELILNFLHMMCALGAAAMSTFDVIVDMDTVQRQHDKLAKIFDYSMAELSSQSSIQRFKITEILVDIAPSLYSQLFNHMYNKVKQNVGDMGQIQTSSQSNIFVEQCIIVIKGIMEIARSDLSVVIDMDVLIKLLCQYCTNLSLDSETITLKCRFCDLVFHVMNKSQYFSFTEKFEFRDFIIGYLIDWNSDIVPKNVVISDSVKSGMKELDVLIMKSIGSLLKSMAKQDKWDLLFKVFTFFENRLLQNMDPTSASYKYCIAGLDALSTVSPSFALQSYINLSNHHDEKIRAELLRLLSKLLKRGLSLSSVDVDADEEASEPQETTKNKLERFLEIFCSYDMRIVFAMLETLKPEDQEEVCDAVVCVFMKRGVDHLLLLFETSINRELASTNVPETLFRSNCIASRLMKAYIARTATSYVKQCLGPVMKHVFSNPVRFEIEPQKVVQRNEDLQQNVDNMTSVLEMCLKNIFVTPIPFVLRKYCSMLYSAVEQKFTRDVTATEPFDFKEIAIGGFLFLRLLCPAVVNPAKYQFVEGNFDHNMMRFCLLISKILQSMANGVFSSAKTPYMAPFEVFLQKWGRLMKEFFASLGTKKSKFMVSDEQTRTASYDEPTMDSHNIAVLLIHRHMYTIFNFIIEKLKDITRVNKIAISESNSGATSKIEQTIVAYDEMSLILRSLGVPTFDKSSSSSSSDQSTEFTSLALDDFSKNMRNVPNLDSEIEAISKIETFYRKDTTAGRPVFYFIASRFVNNDLMIYHILDSMRQTWRDPFVLIIDCTFWKLKTNEIHIATLNRISKMIPKGAKKNVQVVFFNPSTGVKVFLKRLESLLFRVSSKFKFVVGANALAEMLKEPTNIPEISSASESETTHTFSNVQRVTPNGMKETVLRLSPMNLIIITKNEDILSANANLIDFVPISIIKKVSIKKMLLRSKVDFVLKYDNPVKRIYFKHNDRDAIMQAIRTAMTKRHIDIELAKLKQTTTTKELNPSDVPGHLLNIALVNLLADASAIRFEAYNLLFTLTKHLNIPTTKIIESDILSIPRHTEDLVCDVSEDLATKRPDITIEFLLEALKIIETLPTRLQIMVSNYCRPWISNLKNFLPESAVVNSSKEPDEKLEKVKQFFSKLAQITITFGDIFPALIKLWKEIAHDTVCVAHCQDFIITLGTQIGIVHVSFPIVNDLLVTLATHKTVAHRIIQHFTEFLDNLYVPLHSLDQDDSGWSIVQPFTHYLINLAFQNRLNVTEQLPFLINIIVKLAGSGSISFRSLFFTLCTNLIHSLLIEIPPYSDEILQKVKQAISQLKDLEFVEVFGFRKHALSTQEINFFTLRRLVKLFYDLLSLWPKKYTDTWTQKWLSLCTSQINGKIPVMARALCVFGILAQCASIDELQDFLENTQLIWSKNSVMGIQNPLFVCSYLLAVSEILPRLMVNADQQRRDSTIKHACETLIFCILVLPIADEQANYSVFHAIITCMSNVFTLISDNDLFARNKSIGQFFNWICERYNLFDIVELFEATAGVRLKEHFSFALAFLTLKGLTNSATRQATITFFKLLNSISIKHHFLTENALGFICSLIPFESVFSSTHYMQMLFRKEVFKHPRHETAYLFQRLLFLLLETDIPEAQKVTIYTTLLFAFEKMQEIFSTLPISVNQIFKVFTTTNSPDMIVKCALTLINHMSAANYNIDIKNVMAKEDIIPGFQGIKDHSIFGKTKSEKSYISVAVKFLVKVLQFRSTRSGSKIIQAATNDDLGTKRSKIIVLESRRRIGIKNRAPEPAPDNTVEEPVIPDLPSPPPQEVSPNDISPQETEAQAQSLPVL